MANDPAPILDLAERLTDLVDAIAKSPTFDAVPETFRSQWKLAPALAAEGREPTPTGLAQPTARREPRGRKPTVAVGFLPRVRALRQGASSGRVGQFAHNA